LTVNLNSSRISPEKDSAEYSTNEDHFLYLVNNGEKVPLDYVRMPNDRSILFITLRKVILLESSHFPEYPPLEIWFLSEDLEKAVAVEYSAAR
jgi:hypothetical protein